MIADNYTLLEKQIEQGLAFWFICRANKYSKRLNLIPKDKGTEADDARWKALAAEAADEIMNSVIEVFKFYDADGNPYPLPHIIDT